MAITKIIADSITSGAIANTPAFHAYPSSTQSISNGSATKLQFNTETFDIGGCYDTSNYRFLPTTAGKYYFKAVARTATATNWSQIWMEIYKNGSTQVARTIQPHDDYSSVAASVIVEMNGSSDYLEAFFYQNSGGSINLENQSYSCFSEGFKILE
tara:strand:- start:40 stop:507 length:468 start_codon:yes stop_codon:yes gene_type:complete